MAEENLTQVYYIENTQPYIVIDITEVSIPFYVEITDQAHDSTLIEVEDLPIPAVACYIENSKVFNITMDSSGRDGKDGLPGKDGIGIPGKDGISFSFEDLTSEQKALLLQPATTQINNLWASITSLQQLFANTVLNNWFYLDENGNVGTNYNFYSTKEISAYGVGTNEGGGGTNFNRLDEWALYTSDKSGWVLSALLGKELHDRVLVLEAGGGGGGSTVEWGTLTNGYRQLTVEGVTYALAQNTHTHLWADITDKPTTFEPSAHTHTWASIESKPNVITGTTASFTTALETKLNGIASGANNYTHPSTHAPSIIAQDTNNRFVTDANIADWNSKLATSIFTAHAANQTTNVKHLTDAQLSSLTALASYWKLDNDGNLYTEKNVYSTGAVSAYGLGSTGGGGGVGSLVTWGTESAGAVPLTVEGVTKTLSLASHTHSGYLLASDVYAWAKAATKPSYVWSEIGSKPTTFAPSAHTHYKSDILDFAHTHNLSEIGITGLTANYLTKYNGSTLVNSSIYNNSNGNVGIGTTDPSNKLTLVKVLGTSNYTFVAQHNLQFRILNGLGTYQTRALEIGLLDDGTGVIQANEINVGYNKLLLNPAGGNVGIGTTTPTATLDVNGTGKFKDDILMTFNTWTHATDKNSLKKFLGLFDIDTAGNLVVKTNLYSTGEVTAYSSGTGISGLTLMGNLNANSKNINNVLNINAQQLNTSKVLAGVLQIGNNPTGEFPNCVGLFGYRDDEVATYMNLIATYKENTGEYIYANNLFVVDSAGQAAATSFKFGNWTFKEVSGNMVISYNGIAKATIQSSRTNSNL